ncbi:MAG TPA: M50 family metallopeptidase [Ktedonobacteraceae bacterium]|jgi:regulator of sigma E protease
MNNWYLLAAIPVFGLLVLVHEFGHFITAKWAGIRVEEFGLGFPPSLIGFRKRDKGGWEVLWFGHGRDTNSSGNTQTPFGGTSGGVSTASAAPSNHTIYSLNLLPIGGFVRMPGENGDLYDAEGHYDSGSFAAKTASKRLIVLCAGVVMNFLLAIVLFTVAYSGGEPTSPALIGQVAAGSPAAAAGLRAGDTIVSVNGHATAQFNDVVTQVGQVSAHANASQSTFPVHLVVRRPGVAQPLSMTVNARLRPPQGQGSMGITAKIVYVSFPLWQAPIKGIQETFSTLHLFFVGIEQMVSGAVGARLIGPVGIVQLTGQVAQTTPEVGWWPILNLTAMLSLNLALVNILPIPALDGGRVLLILVEVVRGGKRLKPEREGLINLIGMGILLTLIVLVTISDVMHWG